MRVFQNFQLTYNNVYLIENKFSAGFMLFALLLLEHKSENMPNFLAWISIVDKSVCVRA